MAHDGSDYIGIYFSVLVGSTELSDLGADEQALAQRRRVTRLREQGAVEVTVDVDANRRRVGTVWVATVTHLNTHLQ